MRFCGEGREPCSQTSGEFLTWKTSWGAQWGEGGGIDQKGCAWPACPQRLPRDLPVWMPAWSHLHGVGLVAHGHRLAPHVAHAGGLRGLRGHRLWREGL